MATDEEGRKVWQRNLDTRGNPLQKTDNFVPFLYQGQYFDDETGLAYNRFRYYSPSEGTFISQDPIGLAGNNPNLYGYVHDSNSQFDPFGQKIIRLRHYTSNTGLEGIKASNIIKAGDQNAVFAVRAKGKPLSMADAADKFKLTKKNHARNYIDFDIDDSQVKFGKNNLGVEEYKIKGDVKLEPKTTKFVKRCK